MTRRSRPAVEVRKSPRQSRAVDLVEAILEAATRIIREDGLAGLTTNRVAELAGVGIGSLYEYFPGKEAIVVALARRRLAADTAHVAAVIEAALADRTTSPVRPVVRALIALHRQDPALRRVVMGLHVASGLAGEHTGPAAEIDRQLAARPDPRLGGGLTSIAGFTLTRAVLGAVRAAFLERPELLSDPAFEDELVRLAAACLDRPAG
ncbi:TetR/AcrR family transcriptional regulator [Tistrella bauzanensis]|uniref:TetR/AcrR family transcriptional regulator n=1 Tax=Tistrella arctica TaxID=3133430 RepID=A0ABU9YDW0_9PROT